MKKISIFLISIIITSATIAQPKTDFESLWKSVGKLLDKGLTKSALAEIDNIYEIAIRSNNQPEQVKAVTYKMDLNNAFNDDNQNPNIPFLDSLIQISKAPVKNIYQSMLAEMLWNYSTRSRYNSREITPLQNEKNNEDISSWSNLKLTNEIEKLYKASLQNEDQLKNTPIYNFDTILIKGNARNLRPTLFDFLSHRALEYFTSSYSGSIKPAYSFIINDERVFSPAETFATTNFKTKDTSSLKYIALQLYQQIISFHLNNQNPEALINADLVRLSFAYENAIVENKDSLYNDALLQIEKRNNNNPAIAQAIYLRANLLYKKGIENQKSSGIEFVKSKSILEEAIKRFPNSEGAINSQNLLQEILIPSLSVQVEKVNTKGPFRVLISYKNINSVYFRIIKTSNKELDKLNENNENDLNKYTDLKFIKSWNQNLNNPNDYKIHTAEIKFDALVPGTYIILSSIDKDFNKINNIITKNVTYVSNLSYIANNDNDIYILDRVEGLPIQGAKVNVFQRDYNYKKRVYENSLKGSYLSDKNGHVSIKPIKNNSKAYNLQIIYKNDELFVREDYNYSYDYNYYKTTKTYSAFLFTDRSIYRPGQNIYFKGIVFSSDKSGLKKEVVPGKTTIISLYDANNQKKGSLKFITNEYGSYNGFFKLPEDGLTGSYYLYDSALDIRQYFSVEEYKRPKFLVALETPKGEYKINDSIVVTGNAKAYAGNSISEAKLTYRVVRKIQYPIWLYSNLYSGKMFPPFSQDQMEITNGIGTTDENGNFKITFKAIPDESIDKKYQPTFYYEVIADVNDINGETRSSSSTVSVSYQAYTIDINTKDEILPDSLEAIKIATSNTNNVFVKTTINVQVQKLSIPSKIYRKRLWETPDQFTMSKEEFEQLFPFDPYSNEDEITTWPVEKTFVNKSDTTSQNGIWMWPKITLDNGWYKISINSKDKNGENVSAEKYIKVIGNKALPNEPFSLIADKEIAFPGERVDYTIKTGFNKIFLIRSENKMNEKNKNYFNYITNDNPQKSTFYINENDRGGILLNTVFVKHNRIYSDNLGINIPWNNKDLIIDFSTWRDKILPGSNETWKINIKGNKKDKVAAEALINMYDASLDQFKIHSWEKLNNIWPHISKYNNWKLQGGDIANSNIITQPIIDYIPQKEIRFDELINNGWKNQYRIFSLGGAPTKVQNVQRESSQHLNEDLAKPEMQDTQFKEKENSAKKPEEIKSNSEIQIRSNFKETAFFFPDLQTDNEGNISFSFTSPEALTQWKLMIQAHTKDLQSVYAEKTIITQKPLMVQPNMPRFLREGDKIELPAKIVNVTGKELTGTVQLELFDALTNKPIDGWFMNVFPIQYFTAEAGKRAVVNFPINIPINFNSALLYRIKAVSQNDNFSDGEEAIIPVLTNRKLVTETLLLNVKGTASKDFKFEKLLQSANSETLKNYSLTLEFTSNPVWNVVQALPYLQEINFPSSDQYFTAFYSNVLASYIANSTPQLKKVFDKWQKSDTASLLSNLEKNEELKSALLSETPWVLQAKSETEQKHNIALLFNISKLSENQNKFLTKLKNLQTTNGGFSWFKVGPDNRFITQYILTGIGKLKHIGALDNYKDLRSIIDKAIPYLDARIKEEYDDLIKYKADLSKNNLSNSAIQFLYMRSFFDEYKINTESLTAYNYYKSQAKEYWISQNNFMQAMIAVILFRQNDKKSADDILKSLLENSIYNEETGIHWAEKNLYRIFWYEAPVETQSMIIEAFNEITNDTKTIDDLKTWLLKIKQTNNWETSKATADACYALLMNGSNWISDEKDITIKLGNTIINSSKEKTEVGTGYFKKTINGNLVQPNMGNISVDVRSINDIPNQSTSWGAVYWQYFEDLDKISTANNSLNVTKDLFVEVNTDKGPSLKAINDGENIKVGQKVVVRIILKTDRDMEFVHLKDMRSASLEPLDVLSGYTFRNGIAYYQTTLDASTNYYFNFLKKGSYVFEYSTFASQSGNFSNGITTVQCLYAPEFSSHSEGIRINVE